MKKAVVTGGAGFIGSHITEELISKNIPVTVIDNLHSGYLKNIDQYIKNETLKFVQGSILDYDLLLKTFQDAETVFHCAALISVPESMEKSVEYVETNTSGTLQVLKACRESGVQNMTFSSSAAIYGDNPVIPKKEDMLPEPKSPYAVTKLDGEYYCQMFKKEYGLNATALRYFNVFGPRQDPNSAYAAAIPIFINRALNNQDIYIYGDGEQTRDFIYVKDVVQANILAAHGSGGVFNAAYGQKITINDIAQKIIDLTGSNSKIIHMDERPGDVKHSMADNQKIINKLNFSPNANLDKGLSATIEYFKNNIINQKK